MVNYKIIVQYDGTRYRGWQGQNSTEETIQGKIESVLKKLAGKPVALIGSGRTDAGVHAAGQAANFILEEELDAEMVRDYLNRYLPEDIAVLSAEKTDPRFHSRFHAVEKTYLYRIHTGRVPEVFERKYVYHYELPLSAERMKKAAGYLLGEQDFKSFCGNPKMKKTTVRTLYGIELEEIPGELRIYFTGNGFLQNMVRILTGTLIEIGDGRRKPEEMQRILAAKDRREAGYTAPACGLTLLHVAYGKDRK